MKQHNKKNPLSNKDMLRIQECLNSNADNGRKDDRPRKRGAISRIYRLSFYSLIVACCVVFLLIAGLVTTLFVGVNSDYLRDQAKSRLQDILGTSAEIQIGTTEIRLTRNLELSVVAHEISVDAIDQGVNAEHIQSLSLNVSPFALLLGQFYLTGIELDGADIFVTETGGKTHLADLLPLDEHGRVDFDKASDGIFRVLDEVFKALATNRTSEIALNNSTVQFKFSGKEQALSIASASLKAIDGKSVINGSVVWEGETVQIAGEAEFKDQHVQYFDLSLLKIPLQLKSAPNVKRFIGPQNRVNPAYFEMHTVADIKLGGNRANESAKQNLMIAADFQDVTLDLGRIDDIDGKINLRLDYERGSGKLEVQPSQLHLGGLSMDFNGAFGIDASSHNDYRFELVTDKAVSLPSNTSDPSLDFGLKIAGHYDQKSNRIQFSNLDVKTASGEMYGQGTIGFGVGSPELIFMLRIPEMSVPAVKHLWPIDVADGAREWILKNLFGGTVFDSEIDISIPAGFFNASDKPRELTAEEIRADFNIRGTRFDVVGDIPAVRDANGEVAVRGAHTTIKLSEGTAYTADNREVYVSDGTLIIPWGLQRPVIATLDMDVKGNADAVSELLAKRPVNIAHKLPFTPEEITGNVSAAVNVEFSVTRDAPKDSLKWNADINFNDVSLSVPIGGQKISHAQGNIKVNQKAAEIKAQAIVNDIPTRVTLVEPIEDASVKKSQLIQLTIDNKIRDSLFPSARDFFSGTAIVDLASNINHKRHIVVDLTKAQLSLPWIGWRKGAGVKAQLAFDLIEDPYNKEHFTVQNLVLTGDGFKVTGGLEIAKNRLVSAKFPLVQLTKNDNLALQISALDRGYKINITGSEYDARGLIQKLSETVTANKKASNALVGDGLSRIVINAQIGRVSGFYEEQLENLTVSYEAQGANLSSVSISGKTSSGKNFTATNSEQQSMRSISVQSSDAGKILRFLNLYDKVAGGNINLQLSGQSGKELQGHVEARNFAIINEPKLSSIVSTSPSHGSKSLNQSLKKKIDVSRVDIERGFSFIKQGDGYINLSKGVIRGPVVGATFQGNINDKNGSMTITGTFMPAYGLNRMFGDIPVIGAILGNGRDGGLIGITYKVTGEIKNPKVMVNPISVVAPGIFRSIFEY